MLGSCSTEDLLERARDGDSHARDRLVERYLPALRRWARGRLPHAARDLADTDDLVQVSLVRALGKVEGFDYRGKGAFASYLRQILKNQIRDELRKAGRRPAHEGLDDRLAGNGPSPLEQAIGHEQLAAYEAALADLPERTREAVVLRLEMGFTHDEVADALGCPSPNAARMMVARALMQLARAMPHD
jgi:RNA polymerase sigma-70 factor (ECF subfamily)